MAKRLSEIFIIHFQPIELYPPACNLVDYLSKKQENHIVVITTKNTKAKKLEAYENISERIVIRRTPAIVSTSSFRSLQYLFFYLYSLRTLIMHRPGAVLYFDTISSWPALMYKKMKGARVKLLVHYHEYVSPREYERDMRLVKSMHRQEMKTYHLYRWVSQTNEVRLQKMIEDNRLEAVDASVFHAMPNYPSKNWAGAAVTRRDKDKIKLVYAGSLGYDTMYLKELAEWVLKNKEMVSLDLYAYNVDEKALKFLGFIQDDCIQLRDGVNYKELPYILKQYDVGLVIYRPVSENWICNAPNKMFEYLACGLDVWFSQTMAYALAYERDKAFPKVIAVDFENLAAFDIQNAVNREGLEYKETNYFYEDVYGDILKALIE